MLLVVQMLVLDQRLDQMLLLERRIHLLVLPVLLLDYFRSQLRQGYLV